LEERITSKDVCMRWEEINWGLVFYSLGIPIMTLLWNAGFKVFLSNRSFRHSREIFIIQKRFEKEVELTQNLWETLIDNFTITDHLRPQDEFIEEGKTYSKIRNEGWTKWWNSHTDLINVFLKSKPYISNDLKEQVIEYLKLSKKVYLSSQTDWDNYSEFYEDGKKTLKN